MDENALSNFIKYIKSFVKIDVKNFDTAEIKIIYRY